MWRIIRLDLLCPYLNSIGLRGWYSRARTKLEIIKY